MDFSTLATYIFRIGEMNINGKVDAPPIHTTGWIKNRQKCSAGLEIKLVNDFL